MEEDKDAELCRYPGKVKAWCSKCFMTFENGPKSQMVINHLAITDCDSFPCNKPAKAHSSPCVRRFRSTNSANRHTYCYTNEQVQTWDLSLKVENENALVDELMLDTLVLTESPEALLAINSDGGSEGHALRSPAKAEYKHYLPDEADEVPCAVYEIRDEVTVTELMELVKEVLGKEYPKKALTKVKNAYKRFGYTSVKAMRIARQNQGSWEFLYRDFVDVCPEIAAISHIVKYLLTKQTIKSDV